MVESRHGNNWEMRLGRWQDDPAFDDLDVDVVLSDPPYDERTHKNGRRGSWDPDTKTTSPGGESAPKSFDPIDPADIVRPLLEVAGRWVVCMCALEQLGDYAAAAGEERWIRAGFWRKTNPTPQFTGDRPGVPGEGIAIMHPPGRKRWNNGGSAAIWSCNVANSQIGRDERFHETQKPLRLFSDLVEDFTEPGETILDPYAGSATTGVAAILNDRRFIGYEMQERYFDQASDRLEAEESGCTLRDRKLGQEALRFDSTD